ncbi:demethylmenaquinone methyltransferase/2-methoxy-6-polyprenyl-1,4-benzoquinol methylase [Desulfitispora alkaliphila]|uniref:demethylmenaquinone methyltransferase n=1 Tax=Desulfitispora alkaliphila TaxID=622674 RepID=UPI003D194614
MSKIPSGKEKEAYVEQMFDGIAGKYDFVNKLMSFGLDNSWRKFAVRRSEAKDGNRALDVCCGTGMLSIELARAVGSRGHVTGLDFSGKMLEKAEHNLARTSYGDQINFIKGNAMELPFVENSFDCITVGWGLRNVPDIKKALAEMKRVVKPGGKVISLDMAKPTALGFKQMYWLYFEKIVPTMGKFGAGKKSAYSYLHDSAVEFPSQWELADTFAEVGLVETGYHNLCGGVVAVVEGRKGDE